MNPRFHDTIPVRGPVEISPQEADKLIRESWPRPHLAYHAAEAATDVGADDDSTDPLPGGPMAALLLVGLLVVAAAVVAALVIVVLGVAP